MKRIILLFQRLLLWELRTRPIPGYHLTWDGQGCWNQELGSSGSRYLDLVLAILATVDLEVQPDQEPIAYFTPGIGKAWGPGVTAMVPITDSDAVLHTLARKGQIFFEIFSCKPFTRDDRVMIDHMLTQCFSPTRRVMRVRRRPEMSTGEILFRIVFGPLRMVPMLIRSLRGRKRDG